MTYPTYIHSVTVAIACKLTGKKLPVVPSQKLNSGKQADALPTEPCRTMSEPRRTISEPRRTIIFLSLNAVYFQRHSGWRSEGRLERRKGSRSGAAPASAPVFRVRKPVFVHRPGFVHRPNTARNFVLIFQSFGSENRFLSTAQIRPGILC
jgi:hypothetical protein